MDLGKFLETLDADYKELILALAFMFPVSFLDCWKLSVPFRSFLTFSQIMLSLAVAIISIGAGLIFFMWFHIASVGRKDSAQCLPFNFMAVAMPFLCVSLFVLTEVITNRLAFVAYYFAMSLFYITVAFIQRKLRDKSQNDKPGD